MPGVRITTGADFQIVGLRIEVEEDGTFHVPPVTPRLRTDMWPLWLADAIDSATEAQKHAAGIADARAARDDAAVTRLMVRELRASMRAITGAAFAIDAFYSSVKARSPRHPDEDAWRRNGVSRPAQIFGTLHYNLKIRNAGAKEIRRRIGEVFKFRGWAVHPGSKYREPIHREDVDAGVDWHFVIFRAENGANAVAVATSTLDVLVMLLERGGEDLRNYKIAARAAMDEVLDQYESANLPAFDRSEPAAEYTSS